MTAFRLSAEAWRSILAALDYRFDAYGEGPPYGGPI